MRRARPVSTTVVPTAARKDRRTAVRPVRPACTTVEPTAAPTGPAGAVDHPPDRTRGPRRHRPRGPRSASDGPEPRGVRPRLLGPHRPAQPPGRRLLRPLLRRRRRRTDRPPGTAYPFLRVARNGATLPDTAFTSPAGVGATIADQLDDTALWRQFADGATLVLQALHRTWEPVAQFCAGLSTELGHPVQANAYVTPPQNRGFDDHYDVHDVFVLQIEGTKRWLVHRPVHPDPLRDQPWTDRRSAVAEAAASEPYLDVVLAPGDVLYLPRGWLHAAQAQGAVSVHLTLGIHTWTRYALAEQLAQAALATLREDPAMRATLPLGVDGPGADLDLVRESLTAALAQADPAPSSTGPGARRADPHHWDRWPSSRPSTRSAPTLSYGCAGRSRPGWRAPASPPGRLARLPGRRTPRRGPPARRRAPPRRRPGRRARRAPAAGGRPGPLRRARRRR
ncbi:cupin domain-containing protein [Actinomadura keratinilytica]